VTPSRSTIEADLIKLIAGVVNRDPATVQRDADLADVGINSLDLVEAVFVIEEAYGISVPYNANERRVQSVAMLLDQVVDLIEQKAAAPAALVGA